jgi:hypothetical protein
MPARNVRVNARVSFVFTGGRLQGAGRTVERRYFVGLPWASMPWSRSISRHFRARAELANSVKTVSSSSFMQRATRASSVFGTLREC